MTAVPSGLVVIGLWEVTKRKRSHPIQSSFDFFPVRHHLRQQPIKALTVVVFGKRGQIYFLGVNRTE
jgi:hypothetical protein